MTEATIIKQEGPALNTKAEGCGRLLKTFIHYRAESLGHRFKIMKI